jgi:hypothetical protein
MATIAGSSSPFIDHAWLMLARRDGELARRGFLDCLALAGEVGDQFNVGEAPAAGDLLRARHVLPRSRAQIGIAPASA